VASRIDTTGTGWTAILLACLFLIGFGFSYLGSARTPSALVERAHRPWNVWFQADLVRVHANMTYRKSNHYRTKVHPLFSIATHPIVRLLRRTGWTPARAVRVLTAALTGSWLTILGVVLLRMGAGRREAALFSLLAMASAAGVFWTTVAETYLAGSLTMLLVLLLVVDTSRRRTSSGWWVVLSAASLSMTMTNWMTGIFATGASHPWRKSLRITAGALLLVTLAWTVQKAIYPSADFFLGDTEEIDYILIDGAGGPSRRMAVFFLHAMVMPAVQVLDNRFTESWPALSVQFADVGSAGLLGLFSTAVWIGLLASGAIAAWRLERLRRFRRVVGLTLLGQLGLHLLYGEETFLYSLHWLPFLVLVAAMGLFTRFRGVVVLAAAILVVCAGANNLWQFSVATAALEGR